MPDKTTICLVACSASKRAQMARADEIYTGWLFQHSRRWAEIFADSWYVVSAKYGLLYPHEEIAPYDESLTSRDWSGRDYWGHTVTNSLLIQVNPPIGSTIVLLAGGVYRDPIKRHLSNRRPDLAIEEPMAHLPIGKQLEWLIEQTKEATAINAD